MTVSEDDAISTSLEASIGRMTGNIQSGGGAALRASNGRDCLRNVFHFSHLNAEELLLDLNRLGFYSPLVKQHTNRSNAHVTSDLRSPELLFRGSQEIKNGL